MKFSVISLVLLFFVCGGANAAKILVVFPFGKGSHYILGSGVTRVLVEAGHDVTMIASVPQKSPPKTGGKWTDVIVTGFLEYTESQFKDMNIFDMAKMPVVLSVPMMSVIGPTWAKTILNNENVQKLINSNETFDAVIVEQFPFDAVKVLAHRFNAPLIILSSIGANRWVNGFVGNPSPLSYIPEVFLSYSSHMTFAERLKNTLFGIASELIYQLYAYPKQNQISHEVLPDSPHLYDIIHNVSLVFLNSHPSISQPKPTVPCMVEIGGYHISPPKKLPKDLQEYLDNSKEGVIYFSMGSNIKASQMPEERKNLLIKAFSKLKQNVLWKWEEDVLPGQPKNVKTSKWMPQNDILAHPNVKLFITHGGLLSTTETVYHGKPILALPITADQQINAAEAEYNGYALTLNFHDMTDEELDGALNQLLNNPKYYGTAQKRSQIMHDRPLTPQQELVYWTEYVIRHQGAKHLRVAALDLAWYQYLLLDVFAFLAVCVIASFYVLKYVVKKICKCRKQKKNKKNDKLKKN